MFKSIKYTLLSLFTVFKHLFKRPVTLEYPEKKYPLSEHFRGKPIVNSECIKCGTCMKVCPSGAISIQENEFKIDLKKCIFCGNCSFYCPKSAINPSLNPPSHPLWHASHKVTHALLLARKHEPLPEFVL